MTGQRRSVWLALAIMLMAMATVIASIWMHPPSAYRTDRLDQSRGENLQQLSLQIGAYWRSHHELPTDVDTLTHDQAVDPKILQEPDAREAYHYRVLNKTSYQLCALITNSGPIRKHYNWAQISDEPERPRVCYRYLVGQSGHS